MALLEGHGSSRALQAFVHVQEGEAWCLGGLGAKWVFVYQPSAGLQARLIEMSSAVIFLERADECPFPERKPLHPLSPNFQQSFIPPPLPNSSAPLADAGFVDKRSPVPKAFAGPPLGYSKAEVKAYGTHKPLEKVW